jgi:hypothetical protein
MGHQTRLLVCVILGIAMAGCSNSSSPGSGSNNNPNGGNAVGVVGPSVGTVYVISITEKDTNGMSYHTPIYDTAIVVADTITFQGRTNVTQIRDKYYDASLYPNPTIYFGNSYYGYDANGDFYKYDTTYPFQGWHHYPTGSKATTTVQLDPQVFGTDTAWGLTATASYTGSGTTTVGTLSIPTENVLEISKQNLLLIDDYIDLRYAPSLKFYAELIDTLNNTNQIGVGAVNPLIYTHSLIPVN